MYMHLYIYIDNSHTVLYTRYLPNKIIDNCFNTNLLHNIE